MHRILRSFLRAAAAWLGLVRTPPASHAPKSRQVLRQEARLKRKGRS